MRSRSTRLIGLCGVLLITSSVWAQNGLILDQQLDVNGRGYTILRVWGTDYEMGVAQASLLGDAIVQGITQVKSYLGATRYNQARGVAASAIWRPAGIEDEFAGMVATLATTHPTANIDATDLKVVSTLGDWLYGGCRSHTCWGRYVAAPTVTLSTRRLDFSTVIPLMYHHVLCVRAPIDGSPSWVSLTWPGIVTAATGVNEFGTIVSLHDYNSTTDFAAGRLPRMVACRYALTYATDPDVATHLAATFAELQAYEVMTGSFLNYYAPNGHGGVIVCHPSHSGSDFYYCRTPQTTWHHGEAMITTNAWTDGTYTPSDENFGADAYYNDEQPKTQLSHWNLLAQGTYGMHLLSVAVRARGDMTVWADGRLSAGRTPRLEWEWDALVGVADMNCDGAVDFADINPFVDALVAPSAYDANYPHCRRLNADCNHDGIVGFGDINPFVEMLLE